MAKNDAETMRDKTMEKLGISEPMLIGTALDTIGQAAEAGSLEVPLYVIKRKIIGLDEGGIPTSLQCKIKACAEIVLRDELPKLGFSFHQVRDCTMVRW